MISDEMLEQTIERQKEFARLYEEKFKENSKIELAIIDCLQELQQRRWQANISKERLTDRSEDGAYYKKCFDEPCNGEGGDCQVCHFHNMEVCERLAAYEDTGLLPEQIREIDRMYRVLCEKMKNT